MDHPEPADVLYVFAYGSLMSEPAARDHVLGMQRAELKGWRRRFNQLSRTRGCPPDAAPDRTAVPGFVNEQGVRASLALGLVRDPSGLVVGRSVRYRATDRETVLAELQRREGPSYEAHQLTVNLADGRAVTAWTWVSRLGHPRVVDLSIDEQAAVLLAGTPTRDIDGRARGVHYLFAVERSLAAMGSPDPNLAALLDRLRAR